jgi:hypothetical protein
VDRVYHLDRGYECIEEAQSAGRTHQTSPLGQRRILTTHMSIRIALSKGRIFEETAPLLKAAGIIASEDRRLRAS